MKSCSVCKTVKDLSDFHKNKKAKDGSQHRCKECAKHFTQAATKVWRQNNVASCKLSNKITKLKQKYGLDTTEIEKLLDLQVTKGKCGICDRDISFLFQDKRNKPHVDHNHETGEFRGILCLTCNTGIGMFGDSLNLLRKAVTYLESSVQRERLNELAPESPDDVIVRSNENTIVRS